MNFVALIGIVENKKNRAMTLKVEKNECNGEKEN
jgi:hypothetical protein